MLENKQIKAYLILVSLIICGLATATVTANKIVHFGINFPFSNIVFSVFTYPLVDCICELWGRKIARQTVWIALASQMVIVLLLQISIVIPHASFWGDQQQYQTILSTSSHVVIASLLAFIASQILDITVYQKIKNASHGKLLWLRSNVSTFIGQIVDSSIFVSIVFSSSHHMLNILFGSILVKIIISILMTPIIYLIIIGFNKYLGSETLAFKADAEFYKEDSSFNILNRKIGDY